MIRKNKLFSITVAMLMLLFTGCGYTAPDEETLEAAVADQSEDLQEEKTAVLTMYFPDGSTEKFTFIYTEQSHMSAYDGHVYNYRFPDYNDTQKFSDYHNIVSTINNTVYYSI